MKQYLSFFLALLLCFAAVCPAFADFGESETVEKLILIAKEKLAIDDSVMEFSNYYRSESENERTLYALDWESKDENTYKSIHASLDEEGIIHSYSFYEDKGKTKPSFAKYTKEEAIEAAKAFIDSIDPEKLACTKEASIDRSYNNTYTITLQREHNGIPVAYNSLRCSVDADTLQITDYYAAWQDELTFSQGETLTEDAAAKAFNEHIGYELFYHVINEDYENTAKLVYHSRYDENVMIDAITGAPTTLADKIFVGDQSAEKTALMDAAMGSSASANRAQLSQEERELVEKVSSMLSKEKADAISRNMPELGLTEAYALENYTVYRNPDGSYAIGLSYRQKEEEGYSYKSLQLNATDGRITAFYSGGYRPLRSEEKETASIPAEELKQKATAFMKQYYSNEFAQMKEKSFFTPNETSFTFLRMVHDIPVYNNGAQISYDAKTGELQAFTLDWTETEFPDAGQAAEADTANQQAREIGNYHLQYLPIQTEQNRCSAELIYAQDTKPVLDAVTLDSLNYSLKPETETEAPNYTDIAGHYAETRIKKLAEHGVFLKSDAEGRLLPDAHITQLDYFLLLDAVIWQRDYAQDTEYMYRNLIRQNVLTADEVNPEASISRLTGITYLLRALGYGDFITIPEIFINHFSDVKSENAGPVAVAYGLKLISGDGTSFYPDTPLTRADAMIILHNYLQY